MENLKEKIYYGYKKNKVNDLTKTINAFFEEIIIRRNGKEIEDGLQASMIIYPESFAAKVNEDNGKSFHIISNVNLTRFLNGKKNFYSDTEAKSSKEYLTELYQINEEGVELRILDSTDNLSIMIMSNVKYLSLFQLKILRIVLLKCRDIMEKRIYQDVQVGMNTRTNSHEQESLDNKKFQEIFFSIDQELIDYHR